ncbi:MAG: lysophospholipid acyltransferase family protein [Pseudomonadota bacterium]|nr:lysophospholipid acyltransferase family protein [Pseudomonadota bacterium]
MEYLDTKYFSYADPNDPPLKKAFIRLIEYFSGQPYLYNLYREYQKNSNQWDNFWDGCVEQLKLNIEYNNEKLLNVPKEGPLLIIANHPFGVLDGLVICWLSKKIRQKFKILTHSLLLRAPETKGYLLPVDFSETKEALRTNIETRKIARESLKDGGTIIIFPGGTVSTTNNFLNKQAFDPKWRNFTVRLIKRSKPTILPIYFYGQNSPIFHIASQISTTLRSALLFHEVKRRVNTSVPLIIGDPIKYEDLNENLSNDELSKYLRYLTYYLNPEFLNQDIPTGKDFKEW